MADAQFDYMIRLGFSENGAVSQASSAEEKIRQIFQRLNSEISRVGVLDPRSIEAYAAELRTAVKAAFDVDLSSSKVMQALSRTERNAPVYGSRDTKAGILGADLTASSKYLAEQIRVYLANLNKAAVDARSRKTIGEEGGYASETERTRAQAQAALRVELANRQLERAIKKDIDAHETAATREASEAQKIRDQVNKAHYRRMQAEDAAARAAEESAAKERQSNLDAINKSHYRRIQAEDAYARLLEQNEAKERQSNVDEINKAHYRRVQAEDKAARAAEASATKERQDLVDRINKAHYARIQAEDKLARLLESKGAAERQSAIDEINKAHYRRIQAEDKLARIEEAEARAAQERMDAAAAADARAAQFTPSYPGATATGAVGRGQVAVNSAERALEVANLSLARLRATEGRTAEQLIAGERRVEAATAALAAARERLTRAEASNSESSIFQQFHAGFRGQSDRPYAEQIGQALKFSLFYGTAYKMLFAFTQTLQQTLQEGIAFQQALTELQLSTGRADDSMSALADQLGQRSVEAGFAPSQGVIVGARAMGLYGVTQSDEATQARVADISARVVSRMALSSGLQPEDIQTNIAAISQAFGGGPESQFRIADLDAYMSHFFGVPVGSTVAAVSEAGTVGRAAGFNQEEVNAIAADLMARTGQTAPAVAGFMAQIFSRGGEGSLTAVANRYGIDPTLELSQQITELARVYKTASPNEQAQISAAFGRGKVQNAAIALLQDYGSVQEAAAGARTGATGAADKQFELRMNNIGGQIQQTTGIMKEFANQLGQSGVLSVLGAGIVVFRELVSATTGVLRLFNMLDGPLKLVALALAAVATSAGRAAVATGVQSALGAGGATLFRSSGGMYAGGTAIAAGRAAIATEAGVVAPLASRAGIAALGTSAGAAAGALAASVGPIALAVAAFVEIGALYNKAKDLHNAMETATSTLSSSTLGPGSTADDYANRAAQLRATADDQYNATKGFWGATNSFLLGGYLPARESAARLRTAAGSTDIIGQAIARMDAQRAASTTDSSAITAFDKDSLTASMDQITSAGGTAAQQFRALATALDGSTKAANNASDAFDPGRFTLESVDPVLNALTGGLSGDQSNALRDQFDPASVIRSVRDRLGGRNLTKLSDNQLSSMAQGIMDDSRISTLGLDRKQMDNARKSIVDYLTSTRDNLRDLLKGARQLSGSEVSGAVDLLVQTAQDSLGNLQETDFSGRAAVLRRLVRTIQRTMANSGQFTPEALRQLAVARALLAQNEINRLEAMRKVAQQNAHSDAEVSQRGRMFFRREVRAAVRGGAQDQLVQLVGQAGKWGRDVALDAVNDAIAVAREAAQVRQQAIELYTSAITRFTGVKAPKTQEQRYLDQLLGMRDSLKNAITGDKTNVYDTGSDVPGVDTSAASDETRAEREAARAAANAARSGSSVAAARADIASARAAIAKADKNSVAYWQAMGQLYQGQQALADAILERWKNQELLSIDMTNPLAMARVDAEAARRKLRQDRRAGKSQEVLDADRIAVRNAEANREATAFQQRLDAVTTADQLGRISHQKYLRYLNSEHDRLESIKHRTFQQQQELDQIDGLLKDAANAMDAQWNFGDIKLPTPYQMRRYVEDHMKEVQRRGEAQYGGKRAQAQGDLVDAASQLGGSVHAVTNQTTIQINGADVAKVRRVVEDVLGRGHRTRTAQPRRR